MKTKIVLMTLALQATLSFAKLDYDSSLPHSWTYEESSHVLDFEKRTKKSVSFALDGDNQCIETVQKGNITHNLPKKHKSAAQKYCFPELLQQKLRTVAIKNCKEEQIVFLEKKYDPSKSFPKEYKKSVSLNLECRCIQISSSQKTHFLKSVVNPLRIFSGPYSSADSEARACSLSQFAALLNDDPKKEQALEAYREVAKSVGVKIK